MGRGVGGEEGEEEITEGVESGCMTTVGGSDERRGGVAVMCTIHYTSCVEQQKTAGTRRRRRRRGGSGGGAEEEEGMAADAWCDTRQPSVGGLKEGHDSGRRSPLAGE